MTAIERHSTITCPTCRHRQTLTMPINVCVTRYQCPNCGTVLRGNGSIGCVFTAYGSVPCPFMQDERAMVAWFKLLDTRQRQRAQLRAMDPEQWMQRGAPSRPGEDAEVDAAKRRCVDADGTDRPCA